MKLYVTFLVAKYLNDLPAQWHLCLIVIIYSSLQRLTVLFFQIIISAITEVYTQTITSFLPTPSKSHYVFNLRDFARVVQVCITVHEPFIQWGVCKPRVLIGVDEFANNSQMTRE